MAAELGLKTGVVSTGNALDLAEEDLRVMCESGAAVKDMEAAAIAQTCHLYGCPFVVIRALSDIAGGGDNHLSFEQFLEQAAAHSARMVEAMAPTARPGADAREAAPTRHPFSFHSSVSPAINGTMRWSPA